MGIESGSRATRLRRDSNVWRTAGAALTGLLSVMTGVAVTLLPPHLPRAALLSATIAIAFGLTAVLVRDLIKPLLIAMILLGTLQNVPLVYTANAARAGGAPDGVLILPADLALGALVLVLLAYRSIHRSMEAGRNALPQGFVFGVAFCAWGALSAMWSFAPTLSLSEAFRDTLTFATWFMVASFLVEDIGLIRAICTGFLLATIGESVLALAEWFTGGTLGLTYLGLIEVERDITNQALIRVGGTLGDANFLGGYLTMSLPMVGLGVLVFEARWQRLLAGLGLLLGSAALIVTASRGAYLAIAIEVGVAGAILVRARKIQVSVTTVVSALALVVGAALIYGSLGSFAAYRITENDPTTQYRLVLIQTALSVFWSHPLSGTGLNTFAEFLNAHYGYVASTLPEPIPVHNVFLLLLAETGIVGLALFVTWIGIPILGALQRWRSISEASRLILIGNLLAIVGALVVAMVDWSMRSPALQLAFAVILACITAIGMTAQQGQVNELGT